MRERFRCLGATLISLAIVATMFTDLGGTAYAAKASKTHEKSVVCYRLDGTTVQSHRFTNPKGVCQVGWSRHRPTYISPYVRTCADTWVHMVDISDNQDHPINWLHLATVVSGVYLKVAQSNTYVNEDFKKDATAMNKVGLPWGTYYFAEPSQLGGVASAEFFVKHGGGEGVFPPALDMEIASVGPTEAVKWINEFESTVEKLTHRIPIIYTGAYYEWSGNLSLKQWKLWLAAYSQSDKLVTNVCTLRAPNISAPWAHEGWIMWQYSSVTILPGIQNHVDTSVAKGSWFTQWTGAGIQPPVKGYTTFAVPLYGYKSHGPKVLAIQRVLVNRHLLPKRDENSFFGIATKTALQKWQAIIAVTPDGEWSIQTQIASTFFLKHHYPLKSMKSIQKMSTETAKITL